MKRVEIHAVQRQVRSTSYSEAHKQNKERERTVSVYGNAVHPSVYDSVPRICLVGTKFPISTPRARREKQRAEREGTECRGGVLRSLSTPNGSTAVVERPAVHSGAVAVREGGREEEEGRRGGNKSETKCIGQCSKRSGGSRIASPLRPPARPPGRKGREGGRMGACISRH